MSEPPEWLPAKIIIEVGSDQTVAQLYVIFQRDFKQSETQFNGLPVWWDRRILPGEIYEQGFWHLITRSDHISKARLFDVKRAERLPWCKSVIINSRVSEIKVWDYRGPGRRLRTYVWLESWDYVVVLERRRQRIGQIVFLVTAYFVDGEASRKKLKRTYRKREP